MKRYVKLYSRRTALICRGIFLKVSANMSKASVEHLLNLESVYRTVSQGSTVSRGLLPTTTNDYICININVQSKLERNPH